ncbi:retrovirus-related pol polyprotein from transposon TNT 1-94 [Tanacetum coccineum]
MGDENPIRTLGDYSKPSHEGYRNTIKLPVGNNVVPLRSDTIRLVQNECSFHGLRSEDPNQHLKDFLKLVDSLDLDGENRERTRLRLFQFSLRDQASNWLERLPAGSITTWEDLTTRFLAQFFPLGRTVKLRNDILMFQQHHGESLSEAWTRFKDLLQKVPHHGIDLWLQIQPTQVNKITTSCEICSGPHDSQYCMEDPEQAFVEYASSRTNEAGDARLSKFEADFKRQQGEMNNKIDIVLKAITDQIASTLPSDTVKNLKLSTTPILSARSYPTQDPQCSNHVHGSMNAITIHLKQLEGSQVNRHDKGREGEGNLGNTSSNLHPQPDPLASIATEQVQKPNSMLELLGLVPQSSNTKFVCSKKDGGEVMFIEIIQDVDEPQNEDPNEGEGATTEGPTGLSQGRIKIRALLIQHECKAAIEVLPMDMEAQTKAELNKKAQSAVILCLGNKVLREVTRETTAAGVKFEDEDLALLLLTSLPASYEHFVDTLLYRREALTLEEMMATLNSKEIKERSKAKGDDGEGLYVRGRTNHRDSRQSRGKSRSKSQGGILKCYIFQSEDHLKRNCAKNNHKKSTGYVKKDEQTISSGSTYDNFEVMMVMSTQSLLDWIMDLGCSYYMTPRECKIRGIGKSGKVKVINGSRVILFGIRRDNCIYSLDGHAMAGELNVSVEEKDSLEQVWHKRLGHISEAGLHVLEKQGLFGKKSLGGYGFISSDNGLEFCNREFEQLYIESGIARHLTIVRMPQQNRVVERMNRTLMDKVRCLLIQSGLPKTFWVEVTCTAAYLINRSPSRAIEKKTPMEMWLGHLSNYGMLRIFGYVAYPHDKQGKPEPRAVKCVLLRYPKGVKGYRLYRLDYESPKIVTSRNMVFNESVMYKDMLKDSSAGADKSVEELQVEVKLQRLNNHTPEEDQTDQEDGDDEDVGDQETDQTSDLIYY